MWPFAVQYAAHQLNLWPHDSLPKTSPKLRWTGKVGDASVFRVWGSRAFVRDTSADKLSSRAISCVFLGFPPDAPGWQFYHPTSRRVLPSQDVLLPQVCLLEVLREPLSPPQLREWIAQCTCLRSGAAGAGGSAAGGTGAPSPRGTGAAGAGGAVGVGAGGTGAGAARGTRVACPGGAPTGGTKAAGASGAAVVGAGDPGAEDTGAGGAGLGGAGAVGAGSRGTGRPRPYFFPLLQQVLGLPSSTGLTPPLLCPPPAQSQPPLQPASPLPAPSPVPRVPCQRPPPIRGTHHMALRTSSVPQRVPLPSPPASSLADGPDPESDLDRAASPTLPCLLAAVVIDPSFESTAAFALSAELVDFTTACILDYAASLDAEFESDCPLSVGGECALGTDVLEDRQEDLKSFEAAVPHLVSMLIAPEGDPDAPDIPTPRSYAEAITGYYSSQWQTAMDAEMASWKSTGTYVDAVPPPRVNIVNGMWIFRRDYELHSLDFSTAFFQGILHEEIWLRRPPGFTGSFPVGTQWSLWLPLYGLRQAPGKWHDTLRMTLAALGFAPSTVDPSLFLRAEPSLPPFYVLVYSMVHHHPESVTHGAPGPLVLRLSVILATVHSSAYRSLALSSTFERVHASWVDDLATQRSSQGYTFSLGSGSVSWRSTHSFSVLNSSCEVEIYAGAMAALELRWLTYLLTDLGERPCSSPVLYVDNKAMIALCQEHRLEHKTKHIALRYFLARELQQRGQLCLAYVATRANTTDIFTKALQSGDHQPQALYDTVVTRYSSPATAALGRLPLPYQFPELSAFATVKDLVSHLRASDARYRVAAPADAIAVGAARGTPRPPFFDGCSPSPLAPSYAYAAAPNVSVAEDVGAASTSAKRRKSTGKGGRGGGGGSSGGGGGSWSSGGGSSGGGGGSGTGGGSGGSGGDGGGSDGSGGGGTGGGGTGARRVGSGGGQRQQQQRRSETQSPQQLCEWSLQRGASRGSGSCQYVIRTGDRASQTCGRLHTEHRCFSRLDDAWRAKFGDNVELPRWADLLRSRIAIFDLDFDAILSAMYALSVSAEGDFYRCVPPDPGIAAAALGASESGTLPGTVPAQALHTFTLDSGTSRCFFRDSTTLTLLPAPAPVRLADPSGGPVVARSSTVLPCSAVPSGSLSGLHLPSFSTNLVSTADLQDAMVTTTTPGGSSLYTLATEPPQTLLWHRRLGHPSLPHLRGMHSCLLVSRLLVSRLPRSLPPLPPSPAPPCLPCVEGRQRAAPHSSLFPPTTAPLQTLHMDVGGEFSSNLLREFCRGEGILQPFTLPDSPQQNGIAEHCIGLVMEVARTSMIHAVAPHFLWPFAVRYATHQLNLWPHVSLPETSPTLRWTGEVGDASVFRFYHPTSRHVFPSQDVTFDKSVPFYCLFPYRSPLPRPRRSSLLPVAVGSGAAQGSASGGVASRGAEPGGAESEGAGSGSAEPRGEELGGAEPVDVEPEGAEPGVAESEGAESGVAEPRGAALSGGRVGASPRVSLQQLREWFVRRPRLWSAATGAGGAGDAGVGGVGVTVGAGGAGGTVATGPRGARTRGTGAAGTGGVEGAGAGDPSEPGAAGAGGTGAGGAGPRGAGAAGAGAVDPGARGAGDTVRLRQTLFLCFSRFLSGGLTERHEPASRLVSPVRTARRIPRSRPPPVPGTHAMTLRPSSVPLCVPLPPPPDSSFPEVPSPESDRARAAKPIVTRLLATAVTNPSFESAAASALVAELLDFAATCHVDYATALVAEYEFASPPSVGGRPRCTRQPDPALNAEAITGPSSSQWQAAIDAEMASWKSIGTYLDKVPPPWANIVDGMWIFRVMRPPGSPPAFKARYVARGFSQRQGVDYFQTFSPTPKMTTLWVLLHVAAQRDYDLRRPVYGLRQAPHEWHDTLRTTLAALGFAPSTADPSLFLHTDTSLPPFYVLMYIDDLVFATADIEALTFVKSELARRTITQNQSHMVHQVLQRFGFQFSSPQPTPLSTGHSLSAPPSDESVELSGLYQELVGSGSVSWRSTRSSSVLSLSCEAEIYAGAMAVQELRWLTYLLTDLGEQSRSPPVLYVDNKAMIASYQEHRLEHRTKHIALRYFFAQDLEQRSQLRLAYVATRANTADVFTKALPPSDHHRFSTVLSLLHGWEPFHDFSKARNEGIGGDGAPDSFSEFRIGGEIRAPDKAVSNQHNDQTTPTDHASNFTPPATMAAAVASRAILAAPAAALTKAQTKRAFFGNVAGLAPVARRAAPVVRSLAVKAETNYQVIEPLNGDPFVGGLETPVTSAPLVAWFLSNLPGYRTGVNPLLRGVEVGLAHGYLLVGPFVCTGPLRGTEVGQVAGTLGAAALVAILSMCLTVYGIASFKEGAPSTGSTLTLSGRTKEADKLQTADGWASFAGGFFFGGLSGVAWAYILLYVLDLPYPVK
ncbi:unnamed protein product [Closterium sp. NIES-53]